MGIEYVFLLEKGFVVLGDLVIGVDFYICIYGVFGSFLIGIGLIDMVCVMVIGKCWFKVLEVIKFVFYGKKIGWILGKDIIFYIIGMIGVDGVFYKLMEYMGEGLKLFLMDDRFIIVNMVIEVGVKNGIFEVDEKIIEYVKQYFIKFYKIFKVDEDVEYLQVFEIDILKIRFIVVFLYFLENIKIIDEIIEKIYID